jgi:hypothetical protein
MEGKTLLIDMQKNFFLGQYFFVFFTEFLAVLVDEKTFSGRLSIGRKSGGRRSPCRSERYG